MNPLKLKAVKANENSPNPSIEASTNSGKKLATLWADGFIKFEESTEYSTSEVNSFLEVSRNFFTIYNSLSELQDTVEKLQPGNPVIERNL